MKEYIKSFAADTEGAITVDWVVISSLVIGLGIAGVALVLTGNNALGGKVASSLSSAEIQDINFNR